MTNAELRVGKLSYKPLLKLLIDKEMNATDLSKLSGISTSTMTEIRAHRSVTLETILKICVALDCPIEAVVEIELEEVEAEDTVDEEDTATQEAPETDVNGQ